MKKSVMVLAMMMLLSQVAFAQGVSEPPMVFVKGGCFQMGDAVGDGLQNDRPANEVCVSDFYMGTYQVTQLLWKEVMGDNPSKLQDGEGFPVESVSWNDIQRFIKRLNQMTGKKYNLPTEAQWEYVCREGGKAMKFVSNVSEKDLSNYAWYKDNSEGTTHNVGLKQPNGLGVYDMVGNVWVWIRDAYAPNAYADSSTDNPTNKVGEGKRVIRGGNYSSDSSGLRCSKRGSYAPGLKGQDIGFRLVRQE